MIQPHSVWILNLAWMVIGDFLQILKSVDYIHHISECIWSVYELIQVNLVEVSTVFRLITKNHNTECIHSQM